MKLSELFKKLKIKREIDNDFEIFKITKDSRKCTKNCVYFNVQKKYIIHIKN